MRLKRNKHAQGIRTKSDHIPDELSPASAIALQAATLTFNKQQKQQQQLQQLLHILSSPPSSKVEYIPQSPPRASTPKYSIHSYATNKLININGNQRVTSENIPGKLVREPDLPYHEPVRSVSPTRPKRMSISTSKNLKLDTAVSQAPQPPPPLQQQQHQKLDSPSNDALVAANLVARANPQFMIANDNNKLVEDSRAAPPPPPPSTLKSPLSRTSSVSYSSPISRSTSIKRKVHNNNNTSNSNPSGSGSVTSRKSSLTSNVDNSPYMVPNNTVTHHSHTGSSSNNNINTRYTSLGSHSSIHLPNITSPLNSSNQSLVSTTNTQSPATGHTPQHLQSTVLANHEVDENNEISPTGLGVIITAPTPRLEDSFDSFKEENLSNSLAESDLSTNNNDQQDEFENENDGDENDVYSDPFNDQMHSREIRFKDDINDDKLANDNSIIIHNDDSGVQNRNASILHTNNFALPKTRNKSQDQSLRLIKDEVPWVTHVDGDEVSNHSQHNSQDKRDQTSNGVEREISEAKETPTETENNINSIYNADNDIQNKDSVALDIQIIPTQEGSCQVQDQSLNHVSDETPTHGDDNDVKSNCSQHNLEDQRDMKSNEIHREILQAKETPNDTQKNIHFIHNDIGDVRGDKDSKGTTVVDHHDTLQATNQDTEESDQIPNRIFDNSEENNLTQTIFLNNFQGIPIIQHQTTEVQNSQNDAITMPQNMPRNVPKVNIESSNSISSKSHAVQDQNQNQNQSQDQDQDTMLKSNLNKLLEPENFKEEGLKLLPLPMPLSSNSYKDSLVDSSPNLDMDSNSKFDKSFSTSSEFSQDGDRQSSNSEKLNMKTNDTYFLSQSPLLSIKKSSTVETADSHYSSRNETSSPFLKRKPPPSLLESGTILRPPTKDSQRLSMASEADLQNSPEISTYSFNSSNEDLKSKKTRKPPPLTSSMLYSIATTPVLTKDPESYLNENPSAFSLLPPPLQHSLMTNMKPYVEGDNESQLTFDEDLLSMSGSDRLSESTSTLPKYPTYTKEHYHHHPHIPIKGTRKLKKNAKAIFSRGNKSSSHVTQERPAFYVNNTDHSNSNLNPATTSQTSILIPSQTVKLKTTMRKDKKNKEFNVDKPWKYHNDIYSISEQERKRYEGVWVSNKDVCTDLASNNTTKSETVESLKAARFAASQKPNSTQLMHRIIVREIYERSRLPRETLRKIYILVDRHEDGFLRKYEFIVGMWLIDQSLYGRKLPKQVDDGIWESVYNTATVGVNISLGKKKKK